MTSSARISGRLGIVVGLAAAVLFGAATPFSKQLVGDISPQVLAGLLYLGAFAAVGSAVVVRRGTRETGLRRQDARRLTGLIVAGGVVAPVLPLVGLERIAGTTGSLLLNLEGIATLVIGVVVFGEHLSRRAVAGAVVVFVGAGLLAVGSGGSGVDLVGIACVALACVCWGVDNNLTQSLSLRDPFKLVAVKAGAAAVVNLVIAVAFGNDVPVTSLTLAALALGAVSYGISIVLDAYALRLLGAARESIVFATAPFVGAMLAVPILGESLGACEVVAGIAMGIGVALVAVEHHAHWHVHEPLVHEHLHVRDEHHQHVHAVEVGTDGAAHAHVHEHDTTAHSHEHVSDLHHRHGHGDTGGGEDIVRGR